MQVRKAEIILDIVEASKKARAKVGDLSYGEYETYGKYNPSTAARHFGSWTAARKAAARANPAQLAAELKKVQQDELRDQKRAQILDAYLKQLRSTGQAPSMADLVQDNVSKDVLARAWGSLGALEAHVRKEHPDLFKDVRIHSLFSASAFEELDEAVRDHKRFAIATAVTGCKMHEGFRKSLAHWEAENDAALLVMVSSDPAHNRDRGDKELPKSERYGTIDRRLAGELIVLRDTSLNNNLKLSTLKTSAKMIDPMTGIKRLVQRNGNLIVASPKQRQQVVPVSNFKLPHVGMSTGAITIADYSTENYMSERLAYIAEHDHVIGALVVELEDDGEMFHYRQIQADTDGSFYDIAGLVLKKYTPDGVEEVDLDDAGAAAFVMGDWHSGETDPVVAEAWKQVCGIVSPEYLMVHDGFNGLSINHHEMDDHIKRAQRSMNGQLSLEAELKAFAHDLDVLSPLARKSVVVVKSNHDDFLYKYLKNGWYVEDPQNHLFSLDLAKAAIQGEDSLQFAVEKVIGLDTKTNVRWLKRNEDFKIARIQLGAHGDKGSNGSKGTLAQMEESFGFSVTGHSHVPQILRGAWSVGTSSYLKLDYNADSPSSWMNTSCIVYPNGQRQLINCIFGKWALGCPQQATAA